jgi:hypothetical protein
MKPLKSYYNVIKFKSKFYDNIVHISVGAMESLFCSIGMPLEGLVVTGVLYETTFNLIKGMFDRIPNKSARSEKKEAIALKPFLENVEEVYRTVPLSERFDAVKCLTCD